MKRIDSKLNISFEAWQKLLLLIITVILTSAMASVAVARPKCDNPPCQNDGGTGSTLSATFCLNMPGGNLGLESDNKLALNGIDDYCLDRKQSVQVETGSHPGFRFDSNTKSSRPPLRWVKVKFQDGGVTALDDDDNELTTFADGPYQIDLRFNRGSGGLDLGSMLYEGDEGAPLGGYYFVPVNIHFDLKDGTDRFAVAYSDDTDPLGTGALAGNACVRAHTDDARVKRLAPDPLNGGDRWSIESSSGNPTACLWDMNASFDNQLYGTLVNMPFYFEITIIP
jgi:hypothetical protein